LAASVTRMRGQTLLPTLLLGVSLLAGLGVGLGIIPNSAAGAADKPIVGTDRLAQPAAPAPLDGSHKRFIKSEPSRAPRLSSPPPQAGPILPPLTLKGHHDSPPQTTQPLKPEHAHGTPPGGG
jgi:hypothetical protein